MIIIKFASPSACHVLCVAAKHNILLPHAPVRLMPPAEIFTQLSNMVGASYYFSRAACLADEESRVVLLCHVTPRPLFSLSTLTSSILFL